MKSLRLLFLVPTLFFSSHLITEEPNFLYTSWKARKTNTQQKDFSSYSPVHIDPSKPAIHPYTPFFTKHVGFILLAGGQGSRLGSACPKGMVPIPPSNKTLFEIFLRRMVGFHNLYRNWPECAIMTSQETDKETRFYIEENEYFGVPKEHIFFFCQSSLPLLNEQGEPFLENGQICQGPDGNGKIFTCFNDSGLFQQWDQKEVQAVLALPIDNPLMDPLLPSLFKPVLEGTVDASFATLKRRSPLEKVGVFFLEQGRLHVVEYSEIPDTLRYAKNNDGSLTHAWANISVMCLSMKTIDNIHKQELPIHFAQKIKDSFPIYKAEYFIFDNFPYIPKFSVIGLERARFFSPIKSKTGEDSLEQASAAFSKVQEEQAKRLGLSSAEGTDGSFLDPADVYLGN